MIPSLSLRDVPDTSPRNHILSITPSETFHIEDGIELTPAERMEAEQMQKDEQLRRRDPKAYTARILGRKERDPRPFQQDYPLHNHTPAASIDSRTSTQPVRWDAPMIATGDMLCTPSTAPIVVSDTGSELDRPSTSNTSAAVSSDLHQPTPEPLPDSDLKAGKSAPVPAQQQSRPSSIASRRLSVTPEFTSHDAQNHIDESIRNLSIDQAPQPDEALAEAIGHLFQTIKVSVDEPSPERRRCAKKLRKATREEFLAAMSRKGLQNKKMEIPESARSLYATDLRNFINVQTTDEDEYRRLASGLKKLLERDEVNPETMLEIMRQKFPPKDPIISADVTRGAKALVEPTISGHSGHNHMAETIKKKRGSKENKRARKRSLSVDEEHANKKAKNAPTATHIHDSTGAMFHSLLSREAKRRSSRGRS